MGIRAVLRVAALATGVVASVAAAGEWTSAQGWTSSDMERWYTLSQGSRLIPESWLSHLRTPTGQSFATPPAYAAYGYRFMNEADPWPAGFVIDTDDAGRRWLGLNCAACHTAHLTANGSTVVVHGGQAMADFQAFTQDLLAAVRALAADPDATARAGVVPGELDDWLGFRERIQATYDGVERWGHGRADAVGVILATTAAVADPAGRVALPASNAPVSFPFIWNTNQQERLQHNGIVANGDDYGPFAVTRLGALIRNWTEVFGVFATARMAPDGRALETSANIANLLELEQILARLRSPRWPDAFGSLDGERVKRGAALYREHCLACHGIAEASDLQSPFPLKAEPDAGSDGPFVLLQPLVDVSTMSAMQAANAPRSPGLIGTDPLMACNAALHIAPTGLLEGTEKRITIAAPDQPITYGKYAITTEMLTTLMLLDMTARRSELMKAYVEDQLAAAGGMILSLVTRAPDKGYEGASHDPAGAGDAVDQFLGHCADETVRANMRDPGVPLPAYKARPLNGIWATAPFLHNGSVPTLADLLLPPAERPRTFGYLDGSYDVEKAGLADRSGEPRASILRTHDDAGQPILGNFNGGHNYGTALDPDARRDLVEYLKSL